MKTFFAIAGCVALAGILAGSTMMPVQSPPTGSLTVDDLPIGRILHVALTLNAPWGAPTTFTMPSDAGLLISVVSYSDASFSTVNMTFTIDGIDVARNIRVEQSGFQFDPPLLVQPGASLEITYSGSNPGELNLSGYQVFAADL